MNNNTVVTINQYPKDKYNVLFPATMQVMSDMQRVIVNEVTLDTTLDPTGKNGRDIYKEGSTGKYAITKVGAMKLAAAANISIVSSESVTPDVCIKCVDMAKATGKAQPCGNCAHQYDIKYVVTVRVPEPSGGFRLIYGTKEIDCAMEKESMKPDQYKRFLPHRASIAESKALMRCIRTALGLAATYTLEELEKPFVIAHIVPNLDAPEIRDALAQNYLQSMGLLFETPSGHKGLTAGAVTEQQNQRALPEPEPEPDDAPIDADYYDTIDNIIENGVSLPWECDMDTLGDGIYCDDCGLEITETTGKNGQTWTPEAIRGYSEKSFGRCLCTSCQAKAKGAAR